MPPSEPLWYCHECHAEMRPLMTPDPMCASCRGTFVEKMENPEDDPREFAHADGDHFDEEGEPPGLDRFLLTLQALMDGGMANGGARTRPDGSPAASRLSFQITSNNGTRTMSIGGPNTIGTPPGTRASGHGVPTASEFLGHPPGGGPSPRITGPMMAQYLLALLGNRDPLSNMLATGLGGPGMPDSGRMGDYVFNQEALDQIISQLMENSNAHRPTPATDEIMAKLPREILAVGSATLEQDCAVCKDQFKLETEDPDEQIVVTLPCKHPFHEPCIIPWLKSSGTCPVCRYALVPQPNHDHGSPVNPSSPSSSSNLSSASSRPPAPPSPPSNREPGGGFMTSIFGAFAGHNAGSPGSRQRPAFPTASSSSRGSQHRRSNTNPNAQESRRNNQNDTLPGGWTDDLD